MGYLEVEQTTELFDDRLTTKKSGFIFKNTDWYYDGEKLPFKNALCEPIYGTPLIEVHNKIGKNRYKFDTLYNVSTKEITKIADYHRLGVWNFHNADLYEPGYEATMENMTYANYGRVIVKEDGEKIFLKGRKGNDNKYYLEMFTEDENNKLFTDHMHYNDSGILRNAHVYKVVNGEYEPILLNGLYIKNGDPIDKNNESQLLNNWKEEGRQKAAEIKRGLEAKVSKKPAKTTKKVVENTLEDDLDLGPSM